MAEQRGDPAQRRSSGRKGSSRSTGARKKTSGGTKRATGARSSTASTAKRKAPARTTATGKSPAKKPDKVKVAPKSLEAAALRAAAGPPTPRPPSPPPPAPVSPRRRGLGAPVFIGALLIAVAAVVALIMILTASDDENTTVDTTSTPPAIALTPSETGATQDKAQPPAEPAGEPTTRTASCDPIIGSGAANQGRSYAVTSTATDGDPAGCAEARSVLLAALNGGGTTIGDWRCTTDPNGPTIASCSSVGGRKIQAGG
jgi:hypothetical protein